MNDDDLVTTKRLLAKHPNAVVYGLQIGFPNRLSNRRALFGTNTMVIDFG